MERKTVHIARVAFLLGGLTALFAPAVVRAKVSGACSDCHTMHNMQSGAIMMYRGTGPQSALLRTDCVGCHTGTNSGTFDGTLANPPFVLQASAPTYGSTGTEGTSTTLAGGNFYWTTTDATTGHNVSGINNTVATAPGGTVSGPLTCAGTGGCHGDRTVANEYQAIAGGHHGNDSTVYKDGGTLALSYRFLKDVKGMGDASYEYRPGYNTHHNKYYGVDRASESDQSGTVSSLCGACHPNFHRGAGKIADTSGGLSFGSGVWFRHPTDFDMGRAATSTEYTGYAGTANEYSVISPVGTASITTTLNTQVYQAADDAIVMCLSCHRAHGTPYPGILRWNYKQWPSSGYNGCAICHRTKN